MTGSRPENEPSYSSSLGAVRWARGDAPLLAGAA